MSQITDAYARERIDATISCLHLTENFTGILDDFQMNASSRFSETLLRRFQYEYDGLSLDLHSFIHTKFGQLSGTGKETGVIYILSTIESV